MHAHVHMERGANTEREGGMRRGSVGCHEKGMWDRGGGVEGG